MDTSHEEIEWQTSDENLLLEDDTEKDGQMQVDEIDETCTTRTHNTRSHQHKQNRDNHDKKQTVIKMKCSGILRDDSGKKPYIDLRFAKRLARLMVQMNKRAELLGVNSTRKPPTRSSTARTFECTEHVLKFLMSAMNSYVFESMEINNNSDNQVVITHTSRRRVYKDPYIQTEMNYTDLDKEGKRLDIILETRQRGRRNKV